MWQYRVLTNSQGDFWVAEVYLDTDGSLMGYVDAQAWGNSVDSLRSDFIAMAAALATEPIHVDEFPGEEKDFGRVYAAELP